MPEEFRKFWKLAHFDRLQNGRRPKHPTWIKSFVRDLENYEYISQSLAARGFLADFTKLAARLNNRVPSDSKWVSKQLQIRPQVVTNSVNTWIILGYISEFEEHLEISRDRDLDHISEVKKIPSVADSLSTSEGNRSNNLYTSNNPINDDNQVVCVQCDGEGCAWCDQTGRVAVS